jgi:DNA-binding SARP family transcriptional activator/tetratricopeptide (TPR) repeat protein
MRCYVAAEGMEFRILGPLEASDGGSLIPLGPTKQRALLALLLLDANRVVSQRRILEELWDDPPASAAKAIQTYVSGLRKVLPAGSLTTQPPGYSMKVEPDSFDLERFEQLRNAGRSALASHDLDHAAARLSEALTLWRGPALTEFASEPLSRSEGARLQELYLATTEDRTEVLLALGRSGEVAAELDALVAQHPLRERLRGQLMVALYRSGRQAEALSVYQSGRRILVEELGLEPGRALQDLERAILQHDASLDGPPTGHGIRAAEQVIEVPAPARAADRGVFVGREREFDLLRERLDAAAEGRGGLVLLAGEPGVGKTRTAAEFARHASELGASVLWGRCHERAGAPPYWPWLQAIRSHVSSCPPDRLRAELGPCAGVIAEVVPEVSERLGSVEPPAKLTDERQARFRLLDAITQFLRRMGDRRSLVLVLEDIHAADAASLALLEFVAADLGTSRLVVIGTYRDVEVDRSHPLRQTLAELTRSGLCERLSLSGLPSGDVAHFLSSILGEEPSRSLVDAVHERTAGNPLFVTEIGRILLQEGTRELSGGVPEGIREVIGIRLDRLSPAGNETMKIASLLGPEFGLNQLEPLIDERADDEVLALVEEALSAGLLSEAPGEPGRFRFAHPLIQETLEAELSSARRARLHGRIATTLERLYGDAASAHAAELAYHFAEAETAVSPDTVVHYCRIAGEQAYDAHAYDDAIAYFQRALAAREGSAMDDETADLVFALVRSEFLGRDRLDLDGALERMRQAFDYHVEAGNLRRAVEIAAHPVPPVWGQTEVPALLERALDLTADMSLEEGQVLANVGRFAGTNNGDLEAATAAFDRALAIARHQADRALERRVLTLAARVDWWFMRWEQCTEKSLLALQLALDGDDQQSELYARVWLTRDAAIRGDAETARAEAAASLELAERLRERYWLATACLNSFWLAALTGDWAAARAVSDAGLAAQPHDARNLAVRAILEYELGREDVGHANFDRLVDVMHAVDSPSSIEHASAAAAMALSGALTGRGERLASAAVTAEGTLRDPTRIPIFDLYACIALAIVAVEQGDAAAADEHYEALSPQRGTILLPVLLSADRLLGQLALTAGRADDACTLFESALSLCDRAGYRPEGARTAVDYAGALRRRSAPGDAARAKALLDQASETYRALGMQPPRLRPGH